MTRRERVVAFLILLASAALLTVGWRLFFFLADDAFIAFRYVSNSLLGLGYTWNPPPFRRVEGYTSLLWVAILDAFWRVFGIEPPRSANGLSLGASYASLGVIAAMVLKARLSERLSGWRLALLALVLLGVVTNRNFLIFTSSGLETALFTLLILAWVFVALFEDGGPETTRRLAAVAALLTLCRPDGLLFCAATGAIVILRVLAARQPEERSAHRLGALFPLVPLAHLLWRRASYGYWLPNTYYAKHVGAWPSAGAAYLASFVLEYHYYIWIAMAVAAGCVAFAEAVRRSRAGSGPLALMRAGRGVRPLSQAIAIGALVAHFGYYTFVVGGDHFEYRVYQHITPLLLVSCSLLLDRLRWSGPRTTATLAAMVILGLVIPWTHFARTRRDPHGAPQYLIAPLLPSPVRFYGEAWDRLQGYLFHRWVGVRFQTHKTLTERQLRELPTREVGLHIGPEGLPTAVEHAVGVPGWVLPHAVILDVFGLNDLVIARSPGPADPDARRMAHDRRAPPGYIECFRPNLLLPGDGTARLSRRRPPLTAGEVMRCESTFLARASR